MPYRLRNLLAVVTLLGIVACNQAPSSEPASPLQGVWSMTASDPGDGTAVIDPSQPGIYIFAEGYYSGVYAPLAELRGHPRFRSSPLMKRWWRSTKASS